jgi:hypothetical protein
LQPDCGEQAAENVLPECVEPAGPPTNEVIAVTSTDECSVDAGSYEPVGCLEPQQEMTAAPALVEISPDVVGASPDTTSPAEPLENTGVAEELGRTGPYDAPPEEIPVPPVTEFPVEAAIDSPVEQVAQIHEGSDESIIAITSEVMGYVPDTAIEEVNWISPASADLEVAVPAPPISGPPVLERPAPYLHVVHSNFGRAFASWPA